ITDASADAASLTVYGDGAFCGDSHQAVEGRIDDLLAKLSLEEKVIQMHGNSSLTGSGWGTAGNAALGIPGFRMLDGPRGVSLFAGNGSAFPVAIARGASWDVGLERRVGKAIGLEARAKGASVILAPVTSVIRHPRWGRSQESYGEDPLHIGRMGVAFVKGAQQHVISSVKHFAVNSIEDTRMTVDVTVDERTLREIYLPHFRMVVEDADVASVMSAYNLVNDAYCAENSHLLSDILKGEWGFRGFVESDWIFGTHNTVPSALAGLDIEMPIPLIYGQPLIDAVNLGDIDESVIDGALRRILRAQPCFRLDTDPPLPQPDAVESPAHVDLALEAALKGSVLLENKAAALPLDRALLTEIVVTGPLADEENIGDSGSSNVAPTEIVTVLEGMQARSGAVTITHVADPSTPGGMASIAGADAVVVVTGLTSGDEGEQLVGSGDRDSYSLPLDREQLILAVAALNARTIVVLEGGSAIGVEGWIDEVEALLMAWYPGMQGGNAIADLLFGDANPSGKLPLVAAVQESDLPPFINDQDEVTYDYYHGYRLLDRDAVAPRYPFGYGLSYTNYSYSDLTIVDSNLEIDDTLRVTFNVTNTANMAGEEVAQLYVSTVGSSVDRPVRDLEGFARVSLAPGQTKTVSIEVPVDHLAYYDVTLPGWRVETIEYGVHVGPSSADLPLEASFTVE
ncbi:MAG: glycosyl hydrolase, partial [Myxococcales bacterium]